MVKLKRLKIHRFLHVRPGCELRFDDGVNLVLGANATGKTALLGLLAAVVGLDFSAYVDESFALEFELVIDDGYALHMTLQSEGRPSAPPPAGDPRVTPHSERSFQYTATLRRLGDGLEVVISGTPDHTRISSPAWGERVKGGPASSPLRPGFLRGALQNSPAEILLGTWNFFSAARVARFDEGLLCFAAMTGATPPPQAVAAPPPAESVFTYHLRGAVMEGFTPVVRNFLPGDSIEHAIVAAHRDGGAVAITEHDHDAHQHALRGVSIFLPYVLKILGYPGARVRPEVTSYRHDRHKKQHHYAVRGFTFFFDAPGGATVHHDYLSFGQKRLLSFFYYLATSPDFVVADELATGLHRRWIDACMRAIGPRQAFLTSQNPLLFDSVEFASADEAHRKFVVCRAEDDALVWDNITADQAASFFSAYQLHIEPVGEILITRGLW